MSLKLIKIKSDSKIPLKTKVNYNNDDKIK